MYENEFQRIINASAENSLTIFVGAGVSALSHAPRWSDMIDQICDLLGQDRKKSYSSDDFLQIPQIYFNEIGRNKKRYYSFLSKVLDTSTLETNEIHKMLIKLRPASILTTNFDELLEDAAAAECYSMKVIASDDEVSAINGGRFILKVHGDLKHQNIVFKEEDYLSYSDNFKLIETLLKSIFSTNTVLFIGYGLNDYNIKLIMNWAKSLLKDKFNTPVFFYTDNAELTDAQLKYHISRGLSVIDFHDYLSKAEYENDYMIRYKTLLEKVFDYRSDKNAGRNKFERFEWVHNKLQPFLLMNALRPDDITKRLHPHLVVESNGRIISLHTDYNVLEYFYEIMKMSEEEQSRLSKDVINKYNDILTVFNKALVFHSLWNDQFTISFSYNKMLQYTRKKTHSLDTEFIRAFYLAKLSKYREAYFLFLAIEQVAFKSQNYLLFYLSQINRNSLFHSLSSINRNFLYHDDSMMNGIEEAEIEFSKLPIEFQNQFNVYEDLHSTGPLLYSNFYKTFIEAKKLEGRIDASSSGTSVSDNLLYDLHHTLHFIIDNHLYLDDFSEFKESIKHLLDLLLKLYSQQNRRTKINSLQSVFGKEKIVFSEIEFYCLVNCFSSDELKKVISNCEIDVISFTNTDRIRDAILNLMTYYEKLCRLNASLIEKSNIELKIKTCLVLLMHMDIPVPLVTDVCKFLLNYEFKEMTIDVKFSFLYTMLRNSNYLSPETSMIVERAFFCYLDKHITCLENGSEFNCYSKSSINYPYLIHCAYTKPETIRKFTKRINLIIRNNYHIMMEAVLRHYFEYLSKDLQRKARNWAFRHLQSNFDFNIFASVLDNNTSKNKKVIYQLFTYLSAKYLSSNQKKSNCFHLVNENPYEELDNVGYWCFIGLVPHEQFAPFIGISDSFDFFYLYDKFDFNKFDMKFLIGKQDHALIKIAENDAVKEKIRKCIADVLEKHEMHFKDEAEIQKILVKFFC